MNGQVGYLDVMEPPDIDDDATPSDQSVVEYSAVTLNCRATGRPLPSITWKKEHGRVAIRNGTCSLMAESIIVSIKWTVFISIRYLSWEQSHAPAAEYDQRSIVHQ